MNKAELEAELAMAIMSLDAASRAVKDARDTVARVYQRVAEASRISSYTGKE